MKLGEIADVVGGRLVGDRELPIEGVSSPEQAGEGKIVFARNDKEINKARERGASALVVDRELDFKNYILVEDVHLSLAKFLDHFYPEEHPSGISDKAQIGVNVSIGRDVYIAPFVVIEEDVVIEDEVKIYPFTYVGRGSYIGKGSVIFSGVSIYPKTVIGRGVRIHSGVILGGDGFGYVRKEGIRKLNHIGNVVVEDGVEIGANTTVDRALLHTTIVGRNTKVDNLVMIAHNCRIGENNILVAHSAIAGSVSTGKGVIIGGKVAIADHISIGDGAIVVSASNVAKNLEGGKTYGAALPAMEWSRWKRLLFYIQRIPELFKGKR